MSYSSHFTGEVVRNLEQFKKYLHHKRYSENTIRSYSEAVKHFLVQIRKSASDVVNQDLIDYNQRLYKKGFSVSYQNQVASGLKLFFRCVYNKHIEAGTDLRYIQELLRHKSSKTTEIYTHVSNRSIQSIKSTLDTLNI